MQGYARLDAKRALIVTRIAWRERMRTKAQRCRSCSTFPHLQLLRYCERSCNTPQLVKQLEAKLKEEENLQIVSDVASYNLSPEQLAQFLQLANSGRLQDMLSGQAPMPAAAASGKETDAEEDNEQETDNEEEEFLDEENE